MAREPARIRGVRLAVVAAAALLGPLGACSTPTPPMPDSGPRLPSPCSTETPHFTVAD